MKLFSKKRKVQSFSRWSSGHSRRSRCCGCLFWIFLSEPTGPFLSPLDWGCSGTVCSSRWAPWGGSTWWSVKNILVHLRRPASLNFNDVDFVAQTWLSKKKKLWMSFYTKEFLIVTSTFYDIQQRKPSSPLPSWVLWLRPRADRVWRHGDRNRGCQSPTAKSLRSLSSEPSVAVCSCSVLCPTSASVQRDSPGDKRRVFT